MKKVRVKLNEKSYDIVIGHDMLSKLPRALKQLKIGTSAVIITNPLVNRLHGKSLSDVLEKAGFEVKTFTVADGEQSKAADVACDLVNRIARYDVMKKPFVIALGGGVVGDLAGFVASSYKRGVPYVQIPTTLLAQVDSSIGGKVGVDLPVGKNLMGAVYQPKLVWSDTAYLKTLSARQVRNGLAEVIKYGVICDANLFGNVEKNYQKFLSLDKNILTQVVEASSRIKGRVVELDEFDVTGVRAILNYGHTIGHAIEAADGFAHYQHGEAVGLGMRVAGEIAVQKKLWSQDEADRVEALITAVGLPKQIQHVSVKDVLTRMKHDKKFLAGKNRFVLAAKIGLVKLVEGVELNIIQSAVEKYL